MSGPRRVGAGPPAATAGESPPTLRCPARSSRRYASVLILDTTRLHSYHHPAQARRTGTNFGDGGGGRRSRPGRQSPTLGAADHSDRFQPDRALLLPREGVAQRHPCGKGQRRLGATGQVRGRLRHPCTVPVQSEIDRARGALLGTFVGDALGMPFEGAPPAEIPERLTMLDARLGRGTYTDDTQMAIALAESLLDCGGIDADALGRAFAAAYDPRRGYGSGTTKVLRLVRSGVHPHDAASSAFGGEGSQGNGAAMRIAPVAVRHADDMAALEEAARASARVTHAHPLAIDAAVAQAVAVAAALNGEPPLDAALEVATISELKGQLTQAAQLLHSGLEPAELAAALGNRPTGHQSVPAAIYSAAVHESVEAAITFAVRCGGDTDTIGAMAGAIAAARSGAGAIPSGWLDELEEGPKGRSHVERLADRLVAARKR
ncbi:MAG: ADP-ribosylglycohydrolase family protein [Actinobacteria bacterium]|nr:ADP-ribosylglycohydrolase family protein [Actinomycetota bacterium]